MIPGLEGFLTQYPEMRIKPATGSELVLHGNFSFSAQHRGVEIADSYQLRIEVPTDFPYEVPRIVELGKKIPRSRDFHVNDDGTLCLGSRLRLLTVQSHRPTLTGFAAGCLVPYLYAISHKLKYGGAFPFSELGHGLKGEIQDYVDMFGLKRSEQAMYALALLGMKKQRANKLPCPCDCGKRLGKCEFNWTIRRFRKVAGRSWFRMLSSSFSSL